MAMKGSFIIWFLMMLYGLEAEAKCFPYEIAGIVYSSATYNARVISIERASVYRCLLTVEINGVTVSGLSDSKKLCKARLGSEVSLKARSFCCDQPPCPPGPEMEIVFIEKGKGGLNGRRFKE